MKDLQEKLVKITEGVYVERDVLGIVQAVHDYDPNLRIKMLADPQAGFTSAPYRLVELCRDGIERIVFDIWELDQRVLDKIIAADNARGSVILDLEKKNEQERIDFNRRYREKMDEAHDIVATYMKSPKDNKWTVKDGDRLITIEDRG